MLIMARYIPHGLLSFTGTLNTIGLLYSVGSLLLLEVMSIPDTLRKLGFIHKFGPLTLAGVLGRYWHAKY